MLAKYFPAKTMHSVNGIISIVLLSSNYVCVHHQIISTIKLTLCI
jgi:hypothetical protein